MRRRGLERGGELQARQVVREQQIALERADVRRPVGDDARGVVVEEVAVARELLPRPDHVVDIALDHLDAHHRAVAAEVLRRHDRAREHIARRAVFRRDAAGELVEGGERDFAADEVGIERGEVLLGVDGRAGDDDPADGEHDALSTGRCDRGGEGDAGADRLGARARLRRRHLLAHRAGQRARRNRLRGRNDRHENKRQHRQ